MKRNIIKLINVRIWILAIAACLAVQAASAQVRPPLSFNFNYSIAQPLGSVKDYSDKTSFRGLAGWFTIHVERSAGSRP